MNNTTTHNWQYDSTDFGKEKIPENCIGFIYLITNLISGKKYIGKKNFYSHKYSVKTVLIKSGPNKGNKKKKKTKIPIQSDWETYYGSSEYLKNDVASLGEANFERKILRFCYSKSELSYYEIKEQLINDVLLSDDYYNSWISCKIHKAHMKVKDVELVN